MNILDEIIREKRLEVEAKKTSAPVALLNRSVYFNRQCLSLAQILLEGKRTGIIAEFKRRSPSKGMINGTADVLDVTQAYADNGASAISVLTDKKFFGGTNNDLVIARINNIPLLRKDFIIDEYQLVEAKSIGADVVLLIAACLSPQEIKKLAVSAKNMGLEVLLEIHEEKELECICEETELIGINNRNLKTFEVNIERSLQMAEKIPAGKIRIAESGINSAEDILIFRQNGFKGFLVGEFFMKEEDPGLAFTQFVQSLQIITPKAEGF